MRTPALGAPMVALVAAALSAAAATSCTDFVHTNPFHPAFPVEVTLSGPDTLTSLNGVYRFTASTTPDWPDAPLEWAILVGDSGEEARDTSQTISLAAVGDGRYLVKWFGGNDWQNTIVVRAGPHRATKTIVATQRAKYVEFQECPFNVCVAFIESGSGQFSVRLVDSLGSDVLGHTKTPADLAANIVSRNQAITSVTQAGASGSGFAPLTYSATARGSTYLVSTKYGSDSLQVIVDYRPQTFEMQCPARIKVGDSVQLAATAHGPGGIDLLYPVFVRWFLHNPEEATLSATGMLAARSPGMVSISADSFGPAPNSISGDCDIRIDP